MIQSSQFDNIRPYYDEELPSAMQRIVNDIAFPTIASWVFPDENTEQTKKRLLAYKTIKDFQYDTMRKVNERVIEESIEEFTANGVEYLNKDESYLFISNHRDIMLDSCLLQYYLVLNNFETTEITFGANLMSSPLIIDIGKANKMFKVERPSSNIMEFYKSSLEVSKYIRHTITTKRKSVWIAQRNGRTKNGKDRTDQGIIKMFCMSEKNNKINALNDLHIVPIAISYEWEPCDILKTLESFHSLENKYTKKPDEDLNSILTGFLQKKGKVHIELCKPISKNELLQYQSLTATSFHKEVANLLDERIIKAYKLSPNNYIAHDILYRKKEYKNMYNETQYNDFVNYMKFLSSHKITDIEKLKEIFLNIYANPIESKKTYL